MVSFRERSSPHGGSEQSATHPIRRDLQPQPGGQPRTTHTGQPTSPQRPETLQRLLTAYANRIPSPLPKPITPPCRQISLAMPRIPSLAMPTPPDVCQRA